MKKISLMSVEKITVRIILLSVIFSSCTQNKIKVWVASPWKQVMGNTLPGNLQSVSLKAASNEFEPFSIIIHNDGDHQVTGLNVTTSSLKSHDGEITLENIKLYRANFINISKPSPYTSNSAGWYPDALIPFMKKGPGSEGVNATYIAAPFSVDTSQNALIWCDLYIPKGTKAGIYQGKVTVTLRDRKLSDIPVTLEVWDFELPEKIAMASYFGSLNKAANMLDMNVDSEEFQKMEDLYNSELLNNRAVPSTPDNIWPEWNEKEGIIERGEAERIKHLVEYDHFNALDIPFRYPDEPEKCRKYLAATAEWLKKLNYLDIAYVYMEDEPNNAKQYEIVRNQGALIKSANPEIGRMCTEQTVTSDPKWGTLYGAVNIWCPLLGLWDENTARERLASDEKLWSYTALCQGPEDTPWWEIDMAPLNYRSPLWLSWKYDITGFLYWSSVYWGKSKTLEQAWMTPLYNGFWGEGTLLYPGKPAGIEGFVPSIRLKLYREAEEDYEYMTLAAKIGKREEVNKIVNDIVTSFQSWNHDINAYSMARARIAELIVKSK